MRSRLSPSTSTSMKKTKRFSRAKNRWKSSVAVHVPDRVQVDQRADAGDEQRHRHRQRVDQEADVDLEPAGRQPLEQGLGEDRAPPRPGRRGRGRPRSWRRTSRPCSRVASQPASGSPSLRPPKVRMHEAGEGQRRDQPDEFQHRSALQHREVVSGGAGAAAQDGHDEREADHDLGGGDHEHEEHRHLPADVAQLPAEGDEGQVDGVEHELDAHEHHQRVAPDQQAHAAEREEDGPEHEVPGRGDLGEGQPPPPSRAASSSAASALPAGGRLARTTAPTTAMVSSSDGDLEGEDVLAEQDPGRAARRWGGRRSRPRPRPR